MRTGTGDMDTTYHEKCLTCRWLAPKLDPPCGRVFAAAVHVAPFGGDITIDFTPGMVPEQYEAKLKEYLGKVFEWMSAVIEKCPIWDEIGEYQKANPAAAHCPGREESKNPYLKVVR